MYHSIFLIIFTAIVTVSVGNEEKSLGVSIQLIEDSSELFNYNSTKYIHLVSLQKDQQEPYTTFHYTLGARFPGDRIVAQGCNLLNYPRPQNVEQRLWYPVSGLGARVSYVDVWVDQSSNNGIVYVIDGGIGQRKITIIIQAKNTAYFSYRTAIYGY